MRVLLSLLLAALLLAGCGGDDGDGGGDGGAAPTTQAQTPTEVQTVTIPDTAQLEPQPTGEPGFTIRLRGQSDEAQAGAAWRYTVEASDAEGDAASATAKMRVFVDGQLADTLGWFPFEGTYRGTHRWPRALVGKEVVLQAEVEGAGGTQRVNLPVRVT